MHIFLFLYLTTDCFYAVTLCKHPNKHLLEFNSDWSIARLELFLILCFQNYRFILSISLSVRSDLPLTLMAVLEHCLQCQPSSKLVDRSLPFHVATITVLLTKTSHHQTYKPGDFSIMQTGSNLLHFTLPAIQTH